LTSTLPPIGWTLYEQANPPSKNDWLDIINRAVNHGIDPESGPIPDATSPWRIWPKSGWCHDYAVTKRYELMLRGFSASELLLCECIADGQHHLILLVGDVALDNLTDRILPMRYQIVRTQSASNPDFWEAL
jgi:predicted transglutaminase-like cysteine proteinase